MRFDQADLALGELTALARVVDDEQTDEAVGEDQAARRASGAR